MLLVELQNTISKYVVHLLQSYILIMKIILLHYVSKILWNHIVLPPILSSSMSTCQQLHFYRYFDITFTEMLTITIPLVNENCISYIFMKKLYRNVNYDTITSNGIMFQKIIRSMSIHYCIHSQKFGKQT